MIKVIATERIPIKLWLDDIEDEALQQAKNLANLPFAFKHVALMPDSHKGYGMPIGGVLATKGVVIPNAVGSDIGCGVCATPTSVLDYNTDNLKNMMSRIREQIPVGFNHHPKSQGEELMPPIEPQVEASMPVKTGVTDFLKTQYKSALCQLGTLGGNNHFIEFQKDGDHRLWIMLHSGSRNLGSKVASYHNKIAKSLHDKWFTVVPPEWDLAFLPTDTEEGQAYLNDMQYCVDFAYASRKLMMNRIIDIVTEEFKLTDNNVIAMQMGILNIAHNYAKMENHFGQNVMVHRKGATLATDKTVGIIPGSGGSKSYIVRGKGGKDSFNSCSHGAGRRMSSSLANKTLDFDTEVKKLNDQGIIHSIRSKDKLSEADGAYKSIDTVMANQEDLVQILFKLKPLATIKG